MTLVSSLRTLLRIQGQVALMPQRNLTPCKSKVSARALLNVAILFLMACAVGCNGGSYPTPQVTTAVGRAGACEFCRKPIEMIGEENMVTVGSSRFPVCDDTCGAGLQKRLKNQ